MLTVLAALHFLSLSFQEETLTLFVKEVVRPPSSVSTLARSVCHSFVDTSRTSSRSSQQLGEVGQLYVYPFLIPPARLSRALRPTLLDPCVSGLSVFGEFVAKLGILDEIGSLPTVQGQIKVWLIWF